MTDPHRSTFGYSFASMLIGMALLSLVMYATVRPSIWAASLAFSVAIGVLSLALVRGLASAHNRRYLLVFSSAGFAYLALLYSPGFDERVGTRLLTTVGYAGIEGLLYSDRDRGFTAAERRIYEQRRFADSALAAPFSGRSRDYFTIANTSLLPQETWAAVVFHSMFSLVCGLVAGWVAMLPERRKTAASPASNVVE